MIVHALPEPGQIARVGVRMGHAQEVGRPGCEHAGLERQQGQPAGLASSGAPAWLSCKIQVHDQLQHCALQHNKSMLPRRYACWSTPLRPEAPTLKGQWFPCSARPSQSRTLKCNNAAMMFMMRLGPPEVGALWHVGVHLKYALPCALQERASLAFTTNPGVLCKHTQTPLAVCYRTWAA